MELEITDPSGRRWKTSVNKPVVVVGRSARSDVQIRSDMVSSQHIRLKSYRDCIVMEDLGSTNGSFVNGARFQGEVEVSSKDKIQLGPNGPTVRLVGATGSEEADNGVAVVEKKAPKKGPLAKVAVGASLASVLVLALCCVFCGGGGLALVLFLPIEDDPVAEAENVRQPDPQAAAPSTQLNPSPQVNPAPTTGQDDNDQGTGPQPKADAQPAPQTVPPPTKPANPQSEQTSVPPGIVRSVNDEEDLTDAIGFVVVGYSRAVNTKEVVFYVSSGTGFAITPDGHFLTNRHVVEFDEELEKEYGIPAAYRTVWCIVDGDVWVAKVLHISRNFDMGVIKIDVHDRPYFQLTESDEAKRNTEVFALGFPGAARMAVSNEEVVDEILREKQPKFHTDIRSYFNPSDFEFTLTKGVVSRVKKENNGRSWIQHNAQINHGNSGGPLCTDDGAVIGINTLGATGLEDGSVSGIFFAVAMKQLRREIDRYAPNVVWKPVP